MATEERCKLCNQPFTRSNKHLKYCSLDCSIRGNKEITQVVWRAKRSYMNKTEKSAKECEWCQCYFTPHIDEKQRFCSKICAKAHAHMKWISR